MKYKLAFVNDVKNFRESFFYKEELLALMQKHGMQNEYDAKIAPNRNYRWTPKEIFEVLEK